MSHESKSSPSRRDVIATGAHGAALGLLSPYALAGATPARGDVLRVGLVGCGGRGGGRGASIQVPIGDQASADLQPTTIESIRVKPRHSLASRHWTVVKKGDRIVTVIKGELNQQPLRSTPESDFDL